MRPGPACAQASAGMPAPRRRWRDAPGPSSEARNGRRTDAGVQRGKALLPDRPKLPSGERREGRPRHGRGRVEGSGAKRRRGREGPLTAGGIERGAARSPRKACGRPLGQRPSGIATHALSSVENGNVLGFSAVRSSCKWLLHSEDAARGSRHGDSLVAAAGFKESNKVTSLRQERRHLSAIARRATADAVEPSGLSPRVGALRHSGLRSWGATECLRAAISGTQGIRETQ